MTKGLHWIEQDLDSLDHNVWEWFGGFIGLLRWLDAWSLETLE